MTEECKSLAEILELPPSALQGLAGWADPELAKAREKRGGKRLLFRLLVQSRVLVLEFMLKCCLLPCQVGVTTIAKLGASA